MYQYTEAEHEAWLESQTDVNEPSVTDRKSVFRFVRGNKKPNLSPLKTNKDSSYRREILRQIREVRGT